MIRGGIALLVLFALAALTFIVQLDFVSTLYGAVLSVVVLRIGDGVRAAFREHRERYEQSPQMEKGK